MTKNFKYILHGLSVMALISMDAYATQSVSRSSVNMERARAVGAPVTNSSTSPRAKQPVISQRGDTNTVRSTRNVAVRTAVTPNRSTRGTISRATNILSDAGNAIIRHAFGLGRSATMPLTSARSAVPGIARSAVPMGASRARATAVFSDISKLGDGYNNCREAYNTCMDQFCAGANETYRRCFCSNGFRNLRDKEEAIDAAKTMLAKFEDNNLNAVTMTADEVNAMYSATAGEQAIKNDTSGAAALLNDIGDLLSGKKKATDTDVVKSINSLSMDFSSDFDDVWGTDTNSMFADSSATDLSSLEGAELYSQAHSQCMQLVGSSCDGGAVRNMVKSAYNILITQDCNAYQKKVDKSTETVKETVRKAEKMLRDARLDEYRSHNSADVNECMDKVEQALLQPTACGSDFVRCLDYSGVYINSTTGEPIYSARLFGLNEIIQLDGSSDVLRQNPEFNTFLDSKRMYAKSALDTCRDIADVVWEEFKRNALIKISQAQDEKIEEVKMSCVSTMKECYDTQSGALKSFDDTTAQASGALAARAAHDMCNDKVLACAALYGDSDGCVVDTKTNKVTAKSGKKCGLTSLINFVNTVDDVRVAEGCGAAVESYLKQLCTPTAGDEGYPWACRLKKFNTYAMKSDAKTGQTIIGNAVEPGWMLGNDGKGPNKDGSLTSLVVNYALTTCGVDERTRTLEDRAKNEVLQQLENLKEQLGDIIADKCAAGDGIWTDGSDTTAGGVSNGDILESFYSANFGKSHANAQKDYVTDSWGVCLRNTVKSRCDAENTRTESQGWATYDAATGQCRFTLDYYKYQCDMINGVWSPENRCYME